MSHELRTPMNSVLGFGQLLEMDDLNAEQQQSVEQILKSGRHLLGLINEVLDLARIEAEQMSLSLEPVQLSLVLQDACDLVQPLAAKRNVQIDSGWFHTCDHTVLADQQRLKQVLINLLSNAIKYNREGGSVTLTCSHSIRLQESEEPEIEDRRQAARGRRQEDKKIEAAGNALLSSPSGEDVVSVLRLEVSDTGPGIAPENLKKLFVAFERLGAEHTETEGTGIGLALCRRLMEIMGGSIGVQTILGEGSTFWIEIPIGESPDLEAQDQTMDSTTDSADTPRATHTILYIEDNLSNLRLVERILIRHPHLKLLAAMQGGLGLELARQHLPDLILLDLHLPDIGGDEVLQQLRAIAETRDIPVIIISADATPRQIERLLLAGAANYLTKPLDIKRFLQTLEENLPPERPIPL
jgi:signal transduction histidine kinase